MCKTFFLGSNVSGLKRRRYDCTIMWQGAAVSTAPCAPVLRPLTTLRYELIPGKSFFSDTFHFCLLIEWTHRPFECKSLDKLRPHTHLSLLYPVSFLLMYMLFQPCLLKNTNIFRSKRCYIIIILLCNTFFYKGNALFATVFHSEDGWRTCCS